MRREKKKKTKRQKTREECKRESGKGTGKEGKGRTPSTSPGMAENKTILPTGRNHHKETIHGGGIRIQSGCNHANTQGTGGQNDKIDCTGNHGAAF